MNMSIFKAKVKEKKDQAVDYLRCHWKGILLGTAFVGAGIALFILAEENPDAEYPVIDPLKTTYKPEPIIPEVTIVDAPTEPPRPYIWIEDSHPVREHIRHNADGSESLVKAYVKITGGNADEDNQEDEEAVA